MPVSMSPNKNKDNVTMEDVFPVPDATAVAVASQDVAAAAAAFDGKCKLIKLTK